MMLDPQKILVLAPHTDDGELGCGGTIAKFIAAGKEIHYVAFSSCSKSLPAGLPSDTLNKECLAATKMLGIQPNNVRILNYDVRTFSSHRQEILETLVTLNKDLKPDLVFTPSVSDNHQDHETIHKETLRAFRWSSVLGYELPWNNVAFSNQFFVVLSDDEIKKKAEALSAYKSQIHRKYMQNDFILSLAKVRGVQCGHSFAESFEVYKLIS